MRVLALALGLALLNVSAATAGPSTGTIAYVRGRTALLIYPGSALRQPIRLPHTGVPHFSGDAKLVSFGGDIVGRAEVPTSELIWAPTGERAAYVTKSGAAYVWTPSGQQQIVPDGWGAQGVAWSPDGSLALGRAVYVCRTCGGRPTHAEIWVWRDGTLRRLLKTDGGRPEPVAWSNGHVVWWDYPNSASIAADGVAVYADQQRIAASLMYPDYIAVCGRHLAISAGGDRLAMHGKWILFDNRDVSRDKTRSWVSPSCLADGRLVASASANTVPNLLGREHRSIWQLLPSRRRLTNPPEGWTDEDPHLLANGNVVFVRTRQTSFRKNGQWWSTTLGKLELLHSRSLRLLYEIHSSGSVLGGDLPTYYGHYDWPARLAVAP